MADSFSQVTGRSWFGRIMDSIKSVLLGLLLFVASFVLLFWNEGRAVSTAKSLTQGAHDVVSVDAAAVDRANDGKLVHFSGTATTGDLLQDAMFQVSAKALKLQRTVEMYQWVEEKKTSTQKKLGGGEETTTTYNYNKQWSADWHDSSQFNQSTDHVNPPQAVKSDTQVAAKITVGAFTLSPGLVGQITGNQPLALPENAPASVADGFKKSGAGYYHGANADAPVVGDLRVAFAVVKPQDVSVVAQQTSENSLKPYPTSAGKPLEMLEPGTIGAAEMFKLAQDRNAHLTWILRAVGFLAMWIGLMMVLNPLKVLADVVPLFGSLVGAGLALVTLCVALPMSLVTIAVAWFFFRPLLSIGLLLAAAAAVAGIVMILKKRKAGRMAAAVPA